jgi:localization factor PodJL
MAAEYEAAARLIEQGSAEQALAPLQRLADAGFAMAQYRLAKMYEHGDGVAADLVRARQWTERAAAAGNRRAMHDLGVYYAQGEGAPRDEAAAFRWFQQAADLDLADSQFNLGILYEQGRGVEANAGEALFWFLVAARQGDEAAAERAARIEAALDPFEAEQARDRLADFRPRPLDAFANGEFGPLQSAASAAEAAASSAPSDG